jgi:hypothetical protein
MRQPTYDPRVYDLAELFLSDESEINTEKNRHELAVLIQRTIEDELEWMKNHR